MLDNRGPWRLGLPRIEPGTHLFFPRTPVIYGFLFRLETDSKYSAERQPSLAIGSADACCEVEEAVEIRRRRLEAILFVSREPLSLRKLAALAGLADATEVRTLTRQINQIFESEGRAFRIEENAGGLQMLTRPQFAKWLRRLAYIPPEMRLSASTMETLALVAYRQPIQRAAVEAVRGVGSGEMLRQLMQKDLVRICGRSEDLGRPYLYGTTNRFLQLFGLHSIDRLPRADWVRETERSLEPEKVENGMPNTYNSSVSLCPPGCSPEVVQTEVGSDKKESAVKMTVAANGLNETLLELHDPRMSLPLEFVPVRLSNDEDDFEDEEEFEDDDEEDDFDDEEEDLEDDDLEDEEFEEEELEDEEFDEDELEEGEEDEWEEVEEDDEEEDSESEEEDEDWDDDDDDDWDDDDAEEEEEEDWE